MGIKLQNDKGFTLLESLVVVGVISIIIPALFALFFAHLRAQSKIYVLQEVKKNGDAALGTIETLVKENAISVHSASPPTSGNEVCATMSSYTGVLYFLDRNGSYFSFDQTNDKIASSSSVSSTVNLTSDKVKVSAFSLSCTRNSTYSEPLVSVSFTVTQAITATNPSETASLNYQTKMKLRPN